MSATAAAVRRRVQDHLRSPVTRSGYALLLSSVITSVLGLAYWVLAARLVSEAELGRGAALVSAALLVTSLATAGLKRGLIRFVPVAGDKTRALVMRVYAVGLGAALVLGIGLLLGLRGVVDDIGMLNVHPLAPYAFLAGVVVWGAFVLQDAVLIGARRSGLVPVTNTIFSVLKIALLLVFSVTISQAWGVYLSWVLPAAFMAVVVNGWLLRRGLRPRREGGSTEAQPTVSQVVRFTGSEYIAAFVWQAALYVTPLLVLAKAGSVANAHYYLPEQIAYAFLLVSSNVTDALVAEGAMAQHDLGEKVRKVCGQMALLILPGVAIVVAAAPALMGVFGDGYTGEAATTLQLLALSSIPNAVSTVVVAVAHVRRRMWLVITLQSVMAVLTLGISWLLLDEHGVVGVGVAWLVAQTVTAVLAVGLCLVLERGLASGARARLLALVGAGRSRMDDVRARRALRSLLRGVPTGALPDGRGAILGCRHDVYVVAGGTAAVPMVVRVAAGRSGRDVIAAHRAELTAIHRDRQLESVAGLVPEVLAADAGGAWLVESRVPGCPARDLDPGVLPTAELAALQLLEQLHGRTASQVIVGQALVERWVHEPVATVARVLDDEAAVRGLAALHQRLTSELLGRPVTVARLHGDPSFDNLLFSDDGSTVTGMVDWEASTVGLPEVDVVALVLARRSLGGTTELGEDVVDLLANGWSASERDLLGPAWSVNAHVRPTTLLLLTWLAHVSANLSKAERYGRNRWWIRHNVVHVLAAMARPELVGGALDADPLATEAALPSGAEIAEQAEPVRSIAPARSGRSTGLLVACVGAGLAAAAAYTLELPMLFRVAAVLAAVVVCPAVALARHLGTDSALARWVVAGGGVVAFDVLVSEALLYADAWSPGWFLVVVAGVSCTLAAVPARAPRPAPAGAPIPVEPVLDLRDEVGDRMGAGR